MPMAEKLEYFAAPLWKSRRNEKFSPVRPALNLRSEDKYSRPLKIHPFNS